jgi:hypothetical protein
MNKPIKTALEGKKLSVNLWGDWYNTTLHVGTYAADGSPAIEMFLKDGEPFGTLTCCLPGQVKLADDEILVKTWSENEPLAEAAIHSGFFADTAKRISTGFVQAEIWKVLH